MACWSVVGVRVCAVVRRRLARTVVWLAGVFVVVLVFAGSAFAGVPVWHVSVAEVPRIIAPGGEGVLEVTAVNLGDVSVEGGPVTVRDVLPNGLTATGISGEAGGGSNEALTCSLQGLNCVYAKRILPYERLLMKIHVTASGNASLNEVAKAMVLGGNAAGAEANTEISVSSAPVGFGVENMELVASNEDGSLDTQAGSHPFQLTSFLSFNQSQSAGEAVPAALVKDLHFKLPPGLIGNTRAVAQCTEREFAPPKYVITANLCPADTAIGVAAVTLTGFVVGRQTTAVVPLFNLEPSVGEPARFGFEAGGVSVYLDTAVRTGEDYGVTVSVNNITEVLGFVSSQVTFWGVPGDSRHDNARGWNCLHGGELGDKSGCVSSGQQSPAALLSLPTSCSEPWETSVEADSWAEPGEFGAPTIFRLRDGSGGIVGMDGCNRLSLEPRISVAPDGQAGSTPTGVGVRVSAPQDTTVEPSGLAVSDVKGISVTLPSGVEVSPSGADGLLACDAEQIGFEGFREFQPGVRTALFSASSPTCPEAAKIATVKVKTPLLEDELEGAMYLASPQNFSGGVLENPFGSLVAMYLVAEDPVSGTLVKLPGSVALDPGTGQVTATFDDIPQLPFETAELHFFGTARAPLSTPALCGAYTTTASIVPWSGTAARTPSSEFRITSGPNGAPCSSPQPFAPELAAGTTNIQAGAFTPFTLTMTRPDADQTLGRVELRMPPGVSGMLSSVKLCGEPQAAQGTCSEESLIGHTIVSAGLGGDPYTVRGGRVYITAGYHGAPYGLSIVNPAAAGPFVLNEGKPVVVRASIYVDPQTTALRIVSDLLPRILDGIPLQLQHVNVSIDREKFVFNPTSCSRLGIGGTLTSSEGATATVSTAFQVTNCATLAFKPKLAVSTAGRTSRAHGASLSVKLTYPAGAYDANIAKVKVDLPKQLPSRLTTLQKACTAATFEANPANCPTASIVGHAKAITPLLPVPLTGPAYFVSHGGEAFPSLIVVLQGYGATVDLVGTTFINKKGITSSTFKTVPDAPVGSFELTLPQGKYSALAANGNLCKSRLTLPTAFVGQNGAVIHESTPIKVTACPKRKK